MGPALGGALAGSLGPMALFATSSLNDGAALKPLGGSEGPGGEFRHPPPGPEKNIFFLLRGGSGELFGLPIWRKNLRIRPRGYFFMLRSILILPDLEIPLKSQKIKKQRIYFKKSNFSNFDQIMI